MPKKHAEIISDGLMRVVEVSRFLAVSRTKTYEMLDAGTLPYVRIDGGRRIPRRALMEYVTRHLVEHKVTKFPTACGE